MSKNRLMVVSLTLSIFILLTGVAIAQNTAQTKAEYDKVAAQINDVIKKMKEASANSDLDGYNKLDAQLKNLTKEMGRLEGLLKGDQATQQKINAVKQLYNDGLNSYKVSRFNDALSKYNRAITQGKALNNPILNTVIANSYIGQSRVYYKQKKYVEMKTALQEAAKIAPGNFSIYYYLGIANDNLAAPNEAIAAYKKSIDLKSNFQGSHFNLGVAYFEQKQFSNAAASFLEVAKLNPQHDKAFLYLGRAYWDAKSPQKALGYLQQAIQVNPNDWQPYFYLAQVHNNRGSHRDAIDTADDGLKVRRGHGGLLIERGKAHKGLGDKVKALTDFEAAKKDRRYRKNAEYEITILTKFDDGGN